MRYATILLAGCSAPRSCRSCPARSTRSRSSRTHPRTPARATPRSCQEPSTLYPPTLCPAGMVVNGLRAHAGPNANIVNNVDFRCARLDGTNASTVTSQLVHVEGSHDETQGTDTVNCNADAILYQMANRTGTGFDSANLYCAPARCLP